MSRDPADLTNVTDKVPPEPAEDLEDMALREDYALAPEFVAMIASLPGFGCR